MDRRNAIKSMIALAVAPAIVKIEMIMPVKPIVEAETLTVAHVRHAYDLVKNNKVTAQYSFVHPSQVASIMEDQDLLNEASSRAMMGEIAGAPSNFYGMKIITD